MKKRIIVFVSLFILTFSFFVSSNSEVLAKNNDRVMYKGIVTAQYLNVRKVPNKSKSSEELAV
ncbi:MAG: hypothetical protein K0Q87_3656 [Neobacillus sp.]|jgi:hypothetical protein|nr:hypothetical protein [Neobacillus sp.]